MTIKRTLKNKDANDASQPKRRRTAIINDNNKNITQEILEVICMANSIKLNINEMDKDLVSCLEINAKSFGSSLEFILPSLIASTSFCLGLASIKTNKAGKVNVTQYTGLVANSGAGKTPAMNLCENALRNIERFLEINQEKSAISQTSQIVERLSTLNRPNLIGFFDHNMFSYLNESDGSFRENLLRLSRTPDLLMDQSNYKEIKNPIYNLAANFTPRPMYFAFKNEKNSITPGALYKFVISAPMLPKCKAEEIRKTSECEYVEVQSILFFIYIIHKINRSYTLSSESIDLFDDYCDKIYRQCDSLYPVDPYLREMIKQSTLLVARFSVILKALKTSFHYLKDHKCSSKELTTELENICKSKMYSLNAEDFIIESQVLNEAIYLVDYFNRHKVTLSGYDLKSCVKLDLFLEKITTAK